MGTPLTGEIFKVQRPIVTTGADVGGVEILIYDRAKVRVWTWVMDFFDKSHGTQLRKLFGDDMKIYVDGSVNAQGKFCIHQRIYEDFDW